MNKILLDSADIKKASDIEKYYKIAGITTNPTILSKIDISLDEKLKEIKDFTFGKYEVHIQTTENCVEGILEEAKVLKDYFGEKFFIKIPVTKEGLEAIKLCDEAGINVTATAVLSSMQALAAAKNGAKYVAPYINRMENVGQDAEEAIIEIRELLKEYKTEILAASFKNVKQLRNILLCGAEAATVAPEILEASIWHPYTDKSVNDFEKDWKNKFGNNKIISAI
ncbi:transaldolase family protein [Gemella cuniculi]|uniref:transaldolase family protein n=1 Tax=Gemella cuniculi TaxID=150240 RepID=UPI0004212024|nr:transaldolase family protein [Gemella cuniculi]